MYITTSNIENATQLKMVTAVTTYGVGIITLFIFSFCHFFGIECQMYDNKIEKAKATTAEKIVEKAKEAGATGIMDLRIQIDKSTVLMYGTAYK